MTSQKDIVMIDPHTLWDSRYARHDEHRIQRPGDPWLERWRGLIETAREGTILDLGCGSGRDCQYLTELGFDVVAADFSGEALRICHTMAPKAAYRQVDIREPLPFPDGRFQVVIASLCLHYFEWQVTQVIVAEIHRCLRPGGFLFARVNSTGDVNHGAAGHPEVEPNLFLVDGELKRFFDEKHAKEIAATGWRLQGIEEMTVDRYVKPKVLWEIILEKEAPRVYE